VYLDDRASRDSLVNTANEKFAMINLDTPGRLFPIPSTGRLLVADLLQMLGKARQLGGNNEVDIPPAGTATAEAFVPTVRRRRR
jgi:hypothetical protein